MVTKVAKCVHNDAVKNPFVECKTAIGETCEKTKYHFQECFKKESKESVGISGMPQLGRAGSTDAGLKYGDKKR